LQKWLKSPEYYKGPKDFTKYPSDGIDWQDYYATKSFQDYEKRKEIPARLFIFRAKSSPTAVILRRGPRKYWLMIKWNTAKDTFEYGQWFKGYIHVPFCHLSDDGEYFIYFATKFHQQAGQHWTAVCHVPNFTALAMWSNNSVHEGGGRFVTKSVLRLFRSSVESAAVISPKINLRIYNDDDKMPASYNKLFLNTVPQVISSSYGSPHLNPMPLLYEKGVQWDDWRDARICPCDSFHCCPRVEYSKPHLKMTCKWVETSGKTLEMFYRRECTYTLDDQVLGVDWADLDLSQNRLVYSVDGQLFSRSFTLDKDKKLVWNEKKLLEDFTARQYESNK
jgi:hypothetical protein